MTQVRTSRASQAPADPSGEGVAAAGSRRRLLVVALAALTAGLVIAPLLGPLALGALEYRTSPTTLNQLLGSDAAALFVIAPLCVAAAYLVAREHPVGLALASGVGVYALYTYAQVIVGQEYLRLPGNVEVFFPLLLGIFVVAEAVLVLAWRQLPADLPPLSRRLARVTGWTLFALSAFLVLGLHLPTMVTAWTDPQSLTEYASAPTPFWLVKLMDLGIIVPVALVTGVGLLRGRSWARRVVYPLLTGYTCLAVSVFAMAVVMLSRDDPDASIVLVGGFGMFAVVLVVLVAGLFRSLSHDPPES